MKFLCDSCGTKYSISDDRVRGRVLKIRCKKCDFVITVREDVQAAAASFELPSGDEIGAAFDLALGGGGGGSEATTVGGMPSAAGGTDRARMPMPDDAEDWYLSFDGEQEGPFFLEQALKRVRDEMDGDKEIHAWRPSFLVWLPIEEVPELEPARMLARPAARPPLRPGAASPIGAVNQISRDPLGPRAALSVGAPAATRGLGAPGAALGAMPLGGRVDPRKQGAPPIPGAARNGDVQPLAARGSNGSGALPMPSAPDAPSGHAGLFTSGAAASGYGAPASPMFPGPTRPNHAPPGAEPEAPELNISNEASGLVNMEHLAAAAFGRSAAGPAFINGHTGRHARMQDPLESLDPPELVSGTAPVVIMAGAAPAGANPLFKWIAMVALVAVAGLGGGVWYLLTHRPPPDTIIVTEPSRRAADAPITVSDPSVVNGGVDPKHPGTPGSKHTSPPRPGAATAPLAPTAKPSDNLSGSQRALADLYRDEDRAKLHNVGDGPGAHPAAAGGEVSQQAFMAVVSQNRRGLNLCLDRALKRDNSLKSGKIMTQVSVGLSGRVSSVVIPDAQYASSEVGQCFVQTIKRWAFPASTSPYTMEFPFILQGQ